MPPLRQAGAVMTRIRQRHNRDYKIAIHILSEVELHRELEALERHMQELQGHRDLIKREIKLRKRREVRDAQPGVDGVLVGAVIQDQGSATSSA